MTEGQNRSNQDKFMLRLPDGMRDRIRVAAEANNRSMNSEIIAALSERFAPLSPDDVDDPMIKQLLRLAQRIRDRNPKPGSFRAIQANTYERAARDLLNSLGAGTEDLDEE